MTKERERLWVLILGIAGAFLLGVFLWNTLGIGDDLTVRWAVEDILQGRDAAEARKRLDALKDRQRVVDAVKEALDEEGPQQGKVELLAYLQTLREGRAARRAIDSPSVSTRRAAAWSFFGDEDMKESVRAVALDWLRDAGAEMRYRAAHILHRLRAEEASPDLMAVLDDPAADATLVSAALQALRAFGAEGLADKAFAIASDPGRDPNVRGSALSVLDALEGFPPERMRELAIPILGDRKQDKALRIRAAGVLDRKEHAVEEAWQALRNVLFAGAEDDIVVQRSALNALGQTLPLEDLEELLQDRRVYAHRYFAVRSDVASALAVLNSREKLTFDILAEYLVDEDPMDTQHLVRQEAWFSLWQLTGLVVGVEDKAAFARGPQLAPPERSQLWVHGQSRIGVQPSMVDTVRTMAGDLQKMKDVRQIFQSKWPEIERLWQARPAEDEAPPEDDGEDSAER